MKRRKRIAQFFLCIIAFSIVSSALPSVAAFALPESKEVKVDSVKQVQTQIETKLNSPSLFALNTTGLKSSVKAGDPYIPIPDNIVGSLPTTIKQFFYGGKAFNSDKYIAFHGGEDKPTLQKDELKALKNFVTTDMCDRTDEAAYSIGGVGVGGGHPAFLGLLFKLVGQLDDPDIDVTKATVATYEEAIIKPEYTPYTDYDCFPSAWKKKYPTEGSWHNYQRAVGSLKCGTLDVGCRIEQLLRKWVAEGMKTGMTWIMNIATGSGGGGDFKVCRPGIDQDVSTSDRNGAVDPVTGERFTNEYTESDNRDALIDDNIDAGFTADTVAQCNAVLEDYYSDAMSSNSTPSNPDGQLLASGKIDGDHALLASGSSVTSDTTTIFFQKSTNIALVIAVGMVVGAVIQAMVQQKPQLLFRALIVHLPLFGIALIALPVLTKNLMAAIDGISYYMADSSQRDIVRVANAVGTDLANIAKNNAGTINTVTAGTAGTLGAAGVVSAGVVSIPILGATVAGGGQLIIGLLQLSAFILIILTAAFFFQAIGLWALMQFREASILLVLAAMPISMSASIWPALARSANKFIRLLVSLIVAKIPIVMSLSMGLHYMAEWARDPANNVSTTISSGNTSASRVLVMGMAIFGLAFFAPTFILTLFDAAGEMQQSLASRMHSGLGRTGLMYSSQAAGMNGAAGLMGGRRLSMGARNLALPNRIRRPGP